MRRKKKKGSRARSYRGIMAFYGIAEIMGEEFAKIKRTRPTHPDNIGRKDGMLKGIYKSGEIIADYCEGEFSTFDRDDFMSWITGEEVGE